MRPVPFYADLHIHSKYSRACSRDCDLEHLAWWAGRKGLKVVGTGDFTHPAWFEHLQDALIPAEPGLFKLRDDLEKGVARKLPGSCRADVRFMLSVEIATIYRRAERTRKVHHLIYAPDFEAARTLTGELAKIGNLASDGRPILGLDSRDLLEITLSSGSGCYLVPAHIWTPWFSALGSKSGFDSVADCYADLAGHIFAVETGLSSDPPMNFRLQSLDSYRLVSNSDAHSPPMLAREATVFDTELDYFSIRDALRDPAARVGTVEFFPEEGKYHLDGHRKCGRRLRPAQTRRQEGHRCPDCGKPLTVGVLHRVEELADRPDGYRPPHPDTFHNLVPLPEIVAEIRGIGPKSKSVRGEVAALVAELGPELSILQDVPLDMIAKAASPVLAEAVERLRRGDVTAEGGFDGEYGIVRLFQPGELEQRASVPVLFEMVDVQASVASRAGSRPDATGPTVPDESLAGSPPAAATATDVPPEDTPAGDVPAEDTPAEDTPAEVTPAEDMSAGTPLDGSLLGGLDPDQRAAGSTGGPLLVVAGPGTGKTRTLTYRIAHLVLERWVPPERCLAITFTRRACAEMRERLRALMGHRAHLVSVVTFHGLGAAILREYHDRAGLPADFRIAGEAEQRAVAEEAAGSPSEAQRVLSEADSDLRNRYEKALRTHGLVDFDDLVRLPAALMAGEPEIAASYRERYGWICVDEYQDVDEYQYRLLRLITTPDSDLCAIGDPDQAIYGFRGADVGFFLRFQHDYPAARTVVLSRNYRSSDAIVSGAVQAIRPATLVPDRVLRPVADNASGGRITLEAAGTETAEAEGVVTAIDRLIGGSSFHSFDSGRVDSDGLGGLSFADMAVLFRTEAAGRPVVEALTRAGLPFQKRSHDRLTSRPGVSELVRELRHRGSLRLREAAHAAIEGLPPSAAEDRAPHIRSAAELLAPLAERCGGKLDDFLTELALGAEVDTWDPRADRISLLTLHAAKGLEFPVVFLVGCEDGLLPLRWPGEGDAADLDEERRLFFVGMTRARSHLFLSHAASRTRYGQAREAARSPFLSAIDPALLARGGEGRTRRRPRDHQMRLL